MRPVYLAALGLVNALGRGKAAVARGLFAGDRSGLRPESGWFPGKAAWVGRVPGDLAPLPAAFSRDDSRNTRLAVAALAELRDDLDRALVRHGRRRVGVAVGTSTSGIEATERAIAHRLAHGVLPAAFHYRQQEIGRLGPFLAEFLGLEGPAITVSTACTSSGKAMATARHLLDLDLCDVVLTGGADALCKLTLNGFKSLESCAPDPCNPMSRNRRGITIGEGAALFLLGREPAPVALLGLGASSDAHHVSSPDPSGAGAEAAMRLALAEADLDAAALGYVNLHATATPKNDAMESLAMARVFPDGVPCSGTKPLVGHTLGASAAMEAAFCWLSLLDGAGRLPPHRWDGEADADLPPLRLVGEGARLGPSRHCMSNAFAFGGNNLSLILGPTP